MGYVVELTPAVMDPGDAPSPSAALFVSNIRCFSAYGRTENSSVWETPGMLQKPNIFEDLC